ncbi:MAG: hypothetical protein M3270_01080 [Thermoproteota archaeon]|nr:hypothetical protein [Thermoproteota archaeon]
MVVISRTKVDAQATVKSLCQELRIFNPVVSNCTVEVTSIS